MIQDSIIKQHNIIKRLLEIHSLSRAFSIIRSKLPIDKYPSYLSTLNHLEETYKYMLQYMADGFEDENRESVIREVISKLNYFNDVILRDQILKDSPDIYSSTRRYELIKNTNLSSRLAEYEDALKDLNKGGEESDKKRLLESADDSYNLLFCHIWTMFGSPKSDYELLYEKFTNESFPLDSKAGLISALLLDCLSYFDPYAFNLLLDIYESANEQIIKSRSLVALILIAAYNADRLREEDLLVSKMKASFDSQDNAKEIRQAIINIIKAHDTQRISSKMQKEIIPELMKMRPDIMNQMRNISEDSEKDMFEMNPEWEEMIEKSGLGEKLRELTDMQLEGGDVMMAAFSNLKSFSFFNRIANWFLPFNINHSETIGFEKEFKEYLETVLKMGGGMCDSDKYSFLLSLSVMPEAQKKMMAKRMEEQLDQLKEALNQNPFDNSKVDFSQDSNNFIRDLYRFFKLFKKHSDFKDPFKKPLPLLNIPVISDIMSREDIISVVGEFYFKHGYYSEALPLFLNSEESNPADYRLWEKIGYCYNALKDPENASIWYKKAELLNPDSIWLIKKLAMTSRLLNKFKEANEYYEKALTYEPENYHLLMSAGNCNLEEGNFERALQHFYHAQYLNNQSLNPVRAIAWTEFMAGMLSKAEDSYIKLISKEKADESDYLNLGHVFLSQGNIKKALDNYLIVLKMKGNDLNQFKETILKDISVLEKKGVSENTLRLVIDMITYKMNS